MKIRKVDKSSETKPRRIYTRLAGLFLFFGGFVLLTPLTEGWYALFIPVSWFGYVIIPLGLSIVLFPDWWDAHRD